MISTVLTKKGVVPLSLFQKETKCLKISIKILELQKKIRIYYSNDIYIKKNNVRLHLLDGSQF